MNNYLIYKVSGGLNHMLIQINNAIEVSKITNRKLIIDCYSGAFCNDFNKYFTILNFEYYTDYETLKKENILSKDELEKLINSSVKYYNNDYFVNENRVSFGKDEILLLSDRVVTMSVLRKNFEFQNPIRVNSNIIDDIKKNRSISDYIGVHYRNTDLKNDINKIYEEIKKIKSLKKIYLSTDDYTAKNRLVKLLDNSYEIIQFTNPPELQGKNIHYGNPNKDEVILNALTDIYYLTKSDFFIPSENSSFSKRVRKLRQNDDLFCRGSNFLNLYFDKIYVLNLNRRTDRYKKMCKKLDLLDINFEIYTAIDGENLENKVPENYISSNKANKFKFEIACTLSHLEIIKMSKKNKFNRILILEDDILISKSINEMSRKLNEIPDWKLVYFGSSQYNWNVEKIKDNFFLSKECLGTFAYAINSEIYDEIIDELENTNTTVDNSIVKIQNKYYGKCFTFFPNLIVADVSNSDIRESRDNAIHSQKMRWNILTDYI